MRDWKIGLVAVFGLAAAMATALADESVERRFDIGGFAFKTTPGVDAPGGDFLPTRARNLDLCALACANDRRCVGFAWVDPPRGDNRANCWLKSRLGAMRADAPVTIVARTGLARPIGLDLYGQQRMTDEPGFDRPGYDYARIRLDPQTIEAQGTPPGPYDPATWAPQPPQSVSHRTPLLPRTSITPTLTGFDRAVAACGAICFDDARCKAMTAVPAGRADRDYPVCFLKDRVPRLFPMEGVFSGVRLDPPPPR